MQNKSKRERENNQDQHSVDGATDNSSGDLMTYLREIHCYFHPEHEDVIARNIGALTTHV